MVGRRWGAALAAALAVCAGVAEPSWGTELRALRTSETRDGGAVTIMLSDPARVWVTAARDLDGALARVYVDLAAGTRVAAGVTPTEPVGPVGRARVGLAEDGAVRVAIDVGAVDDYRVDRQAGGREIRVVLFATPADPAGATVAPPAAAGSPAAAPPVTRRASTRVGHPKIVLDPGHGGHDPGAQGYAVEKDVTLAIARQLAARLRTELAADVVLTRARDETLTLGERTARANAEDADLFVSIHANANPTRRLHGVETYYLDNTGDRATIRLAALENGGAPPGKGQTDLHYILSDLVQVGKMDESIALATAVQRAVVARLRARYGGVTDLGVKRGPFYVLVGAHMPCVLVEGAFLSHPIEGRRLARPEYQAAVADGLYAGIARFLADGRRRRTL